MGLIFNPSLLFENFYIQFTY